MSMLRLCRKFCFCGLFPFNIFDDPDKIYDTSQTAKSIIEDQTNQPTGLDRLYVMFSTDEFGTHSPELHIVYQTGFLGAFVGACIGGFIHSRTAYMNFMETNQATSFANHLDAKRKLQDEVSKSFAKGAFKWSWRLGLFSSSYMLATTAVSVYRGKSSILEYTVAGCATGALYKMNLGPRGMLVGGIVGSLLGLMTGGLSLTIMDVTGTSMENVRFWQYKWKEHRMKQEQDMLKKHDEEDNVLLQAHNKKYGSDDVSLSTLGADTRAGQ